MNAIFSMKNKITGESWIGKSQNPSKKHKDIIKFLNANSEPIEDSPHDYDDNCPSCEFFDNCLGWDDKKICQDWMREYFNKHPKERRDPNNPDS